MLSKMISFVMNLNAMIAKQKKNILYDYSKRHKT